MKFMLAAAATAVMLMSTTAFAEPGYYWHRHHEYNRYEQRHHRYEHNAWCRLIQSGPFGKPTYICKY